MSKDKWCALAREDFEHALDEMGSVVDVSVKIMCLFDFCETNLGMRTQHLRQPSRSRLSRSEPKKIW